MAGILRVPDWFDLVYVLQRLQVFQMVLFSLQNQCTGTAWHRINRHCMPLNWEILREKQLKKFAVHILYNGTSQASGAPPRGKRLLGAHKQSSPCPGPPALQANLAHRGLFRPPRTDFTLVYACPHSFCTQLLTRCQIEVEPLYQKLR